MVPVVLIIYNRVYATERLWKEIEEIQPEKLYVIADAPNINRKDDRLKNVQVKAVTENITWECQVERIYAEENMGCDKRIVTGLGEVFAKEDRAIILEDDCIPDPTFFAFCEEMLSRYEENKKIMYISGDNMSRIKKQGTYWFSKRGDTWGWATWADRWKCMRGQFEKDWKQIKKDGLLRKNRGFFPARYFIKELEGYKKYGVIPWDARWQAYAQAGGKLAVVPGVNLVRNIGIGEDSTHTKSGAEDMSIEAESMHFPLVHPDEIKGNKKYDVNRYRELFHRPISVRVRQRINRFIRSYLRKNIG